MVVNGPDRIRLDVGPSPKDDIDVVFTRTRSIAWNDDGNGTVVIKATGDLPTWRVNAAADKIFPGTAEIVAGNAEAGACGGMGEIGHIVAVYVISDQR